MAHIYVSTESELKPGFDTEKPSKTQLKAEMEALQQLGGRLIGLSKEKLQQLNLPERLYDETLKANKITANGAKARQLQFLGKLMRSLDEAHIAHIQERFLAWDGLSKAETSKLHLIEHWRDAMLANDEAIGEFVQSYGVNTEDLQTMRNLIRQARKDATSQKPPKNARVLFQLVKHYIQGTTSQLAATSNDENIT